MTEIYHPEYDQVRSFIDTWRRKGKSWEDIKNLVWVSSDSIQSFLNRKSNDDGWPALDVKTWTEIVDDSRENEEAAQIIDDPLGAALLTDKPVTADFKPMPTNPRSQWMLYKKHLLENGFNEKTVERIEKSTEKVLNQLQLETRPGEPVKGVVIGNVQSGKTANMAALIAAAADYGYNMFIVLTGTIENLRKQTEDRLYRDLTSGGFGNLRWQLLHDLKKNCYTENALKNLALGEKEHTRYLYLCLKNSTRLKQLLEWIYRDKNKARQLKILIIDDEADQAGINTKKIDKKEYTRINGYIRHLVHNQKDAGKDPETAFRAMNYIGYTATPYANLLNESFEIKNSLYPKSFIKTLDQSEDYFGPQQIFGADACEIMVDGKPFTLDGMSIVRIIPDKDIEQVKGVHQGILAPVPETLADSMMWFLTSVAALRTQGYHKPLSMLIHTSQLTDHHEFMAEMVKNWFQQEMQDPDAFLKKCEAVYETETQNFTLENLKEEFPYYGSLSSVKDYPPFEDILPELKYLINEQITNIKMEDSDFTYTNGIHLCVDNSRSSGVGAEDEYLRLVYPTAENMPEKAPAFIVVGGATLARGLTIEGLISTYFLRSAGQADTLMQMGRWFGYRKNYEMYPRVWMSANTLKQFKYLSSMDFELRSDIKEMELQGLGPTEYSPHVLKPSTSKTKVTAANRMQSAVESGKSLSGLMHQTYIFDEDLPVIENNYNVSEKLVSELGTPGKENPGHYIWYNVAPEKIEQYFRDYRFVNKGSYQTDIEGVLKWIDSLKNTDESIESWNVVLVNNTDANASHIDFGGLKLGTVQRSRKTDSPQGIINIGALLNPSDLISDLDKTKITNPEVRKAIIDFKKISHSAAAARTLRKVAGYGRVPLLLLYVIDKNSKARKSRGKAASFRTDLGVDHDMVGMTFLLPSLKDEKQSAGYYILPVRSAESLDDQLDVEGAE